MKIKINSKYDIIIFGAGITGTYIASLFPTKKILIIEKQKYSYQVSSFLNQSHIHQGYAFPNHTDIPEFIDLYNSFIKKYSSSIEKKSHLYVLNSESNITEEEYDSFCQKNELRIEKTNANKFFNDDNSIGYVTYEPTLNIEKFKKILFKKISPNTTILYETNIKSYETKGRHYYIQLDDDEKTIIRTPIIINATYANTNNINELFNIPKWDLTFEKIELVLGKSSDWRYEGVTLINKFSLCPFNNYGLHTVEIINEHECKENCLDNCQLCEYKPTSKWDNNYLQKYLKDDITFKYKNSMYVIKPKIKNVENIITKVKLEQNKPCFITAFAGKIHTLYKLNDIIKIVKNLGLGE